MGWMDGKWETPASPNHPPPNSPPPPKKKTRLANKRNGRGMLLLTDGG